MEDYIITIFIALSALIAGAVLAYFLNQALLKNKSTNIIKEAQAEAEVIKKDKILQAKEKFFQLKSEHEKVINEKNQRVLVVENRLKQREVSSSQK